MSARRHHGDDRDVLPKSDQASSVEGESRSPVRMGRRSGLEVLADEANALRLELQEMGMM
jgi:hypothetical protein